MPDQYIYQSVELEYGGHLSVEYSAGFRSGAALNIYPFIIELYIPQTLGIVLTIFTHDHIGSGKWYR